MNLKLTKMMVGVSVVASAIFFTACMGEKKMGSAKDLEVTEFSELIQSQDTLILIDVESDQMGDIMITGAIAYPINNEQDADSAIKKFGTTTPYAVYDMMGTKSKKAADMLAKKGATVYNLKNGLSDWIEEDQMIVIMPLDSTMTAPIRTTKSQLMSDSTMMTKLKIK